MELRREAERSKEEKNEVVLVGRFDSNQFVYVVVGLRTVVRGNFNIHGTKNF